MLQNLFANEKSSDDEYWAGRDYGLAAQCHNRAASEALNKNSSSLIHLRMF
jgi:hypothetical protein